MKLLLRFFFSPRKMHNSTSGSYENMNIFIYTERLYNITNQCKQQRINLYFQINYMEDITDYCLNLQSWLTKPYKNVSEINSIR